MNNRSTITFSVPSDECNSIDEMVQLTGCRGRAEYFRLLHKIGKKTLDLSELEKKLLVSLSELTKFTNTPNLEQLARHCKDSEESVKNAFYSLLNHSFFLCICDEKEADLSKFSFSCVVDGKYYQVSSAGRNASMLLIKSSDILELV